MRARLLTDREYRIIKVYLESGERLEGFGMIKHRFLKSGFDAVKAEIDVQLLQSFKELLESNSHE